MDSLRHNGEPGALRTDPEWQRRQPLHERVVDLKFELRRGLNVPRETICGLLDDLLERVQEMEDVAGDATKTVDRR